MSFAGLNGLFSPYLMVMLCYVISFTVKLAIHYLACDLSDKDPDTD